MEEQNQKKQEQQGSIVDNANLVYKNAQSLKNNYRKLKNVGTAAKNTRRAVSFARAAFVAGQAVLDVTVGVVGSVAGVIGGATAGTVLLVIGLVVLIILLVASIVIIIIGGSNSTALAGDLPTFCDGINSSSLTATTTNPVTLSASNCNNDGGALTYQWNKSDSGGVFSNPTGVSTTYTPSSNTVKDVSITLNVCDAADTNNCFLYNLVINSSAPVGVVNAKYYCQYASAWQTSSCDIASFGCTQTSVGMAMSSYRTDTYYNPLKVAIDNGGVDGCSKGTSLTSFNSGLVSYMQRNGYTVASSVASGTSFNMSLAKQYINNGYVIVAAGSVWFKSTTQLVPKGHAFLITNVDPATNSIYVYDPTYCPWKGGDSLDGVRKMVPQTYPCTYTAFFDAKPVASNCLGKNNGGNIYVFNISNGGQGWYYARPVKK